MINFVHWNHHSTTQKLEAIVAVMHLKSTAGECMAGLENRILRHTKQELHTSDCRQSCAPARSAPTASACVTTSVHLNSRNSEAAVGRCVSVICDPLYTHIIQGTSIVIHYAIINTFKVVISSFSE